KQHGTRPSIPAENTMSNSCQWMPQTRSRPDVFLHIHEFKQHITLRTHILGLDARASTEKHTESSIVATLSSKVQGSRPLRMSDGSHQLGQTRTRGRTKFCASVRSSNSLHSARTLLASTLAPARKSA